VEGAGAKASRLSPRRVRAFSEFLPLPADASRTYRPNPQATTKPAPGPPSLKGYEINPFCFDRGKKGMVNVYKGLIERNFSVYII
jgi:hypothetical protein